MEVLRFALPPTFDRPQPQPAHGSPPAEAHLEVLAAELSARASSLREELVARLGAVVDVTVSRSYDTMLRNLVSGAVHAAHAPPMVCAQLEQRGIPVVGRVVRGGRASYASALITRASAPASLQALADIRAIWVDPFSLGGYLLPAAHLRAHRGLDVRRAFKSRSFAGSYPRALQALLDGEADLTAVHALPGRPASALIAAERYLPGCSGALRVLELTDEAPGDGILITHPTFTAPLARVLFAAHEDAAGKAMLETAFAAEAIEPAQPQAYQTLYPLLRQARP